MASKQFLGIFFFFLFFFYVIIFLQTKFSLVLFHLRYFTSDCTSHHSYGSFIENCLFWCKLFTGEAGLTVHDRRDLNVAVITSECHQYS